jgi:hypothetical protein
MRRVRPCRPSPFLVSRESAPPNNSKKQTFHCTKLVLLKLASRRRSPDSPSVPDPARTDKEGGTRNSLRKLSERYTCDTSSPTSFASGCNKLIVDSDGWSRQEVFAWRQIEVTRRVCRSVGVVNRTGGVDPRLAEGIPGMSL